MSETFLHGVQVLEVDTGARPIRTVRSSVIGLVGQGNFDGAAAQVTIGTSNSQVRFYALNNGANANAFTIRCIKPSTNNAALSVTRSGNVITISLATDGSAVATSTATQVQTAFNAAGITIPTATGSVTINATASVVGSNGTGLYAVHAATALVGGVNDSFPLNTPVLVTNPIGIDAALGADTYLGKALEAIFKQSGALVVVRRIVDDPSFRLRVAGAGHLRRANLSIVAAAGVAAVEVSEGLQMEIKTSHHAKKNIPLPSKNEK
jgi:phage tail sheath protein FI